MWSTSDALKLGNLTNKTGLWAWHTCWPDIGFWVIRLIEDTSSVWSCLLLPASVRAPSQASTIEVSLCYRLYSTWSDILFILCNACHCYNLGKKLCSHGWTAMQNACVFVCKTESFKTLTKNMLAELASLDLASRMWYKLHEHLSFACSERHVSVLMHKDV